MGSIQDLGLIKNWNHEILMKSDLLILLVLVRQQEKVNKKLRSFGF